jgi:hypothetical protein
MEPTRRWFTLVWLATYIIHGNETVKATLALLIILAPMTALHAAEFDITKFGATPNDDNDDTLAIRARWTLAARQAEGPSLCRWACQR